MPVTPGAMPHQRAGSGLSSGRGAHYVRGESDGPNHGRQSKRDQRAVGPPASLIWFHDHGLGTTRLNVFAGLAGAYLHYDEFDTGDASNANGLPSGAREIPLVIQGRQFNASGTFLYPTSVIPGATWIGEYFGDVMLVNGIVWPYLQVKPRLYRFRIINGCNARILDLGFDLPSGLTTPQKYVHHCHIVEHEDNDMMRPFIVNPAA